MFRETQGKVDASCHRVFISRFSVVKTHISMHKISNHEDHIKIDLHHDDQYQIFRHIISGN